MLRWSVAETSGMVDLRAIADPMIDPGIPAGRQLLALVDAIVLRDHHERDDAQAALVDAAGADAAVRAAAVTGNFEMMNRHLDALAIGPTATSAAIAPELGIPWPPP